MIVNEAPDPGTPPQRASVHPDHDAVAQEVVGWFTASTPEIGSVVSEHWYGYQSDVSPTHARVILRVDEPDGVPAALADASTASGMRSLTIWVDNRERAARLDATLRRTGCQPGEATTNLALVGPLTGRTGPEHLVIETIDDAGLEEWATVKLQSFSDTESMPSPDQLAEQVAARRGEQALAECHLGRLDGESVAVLGCYRGSDQLVFNLGTRVPYRHQGIAQAMLARWVEAGTASGCRSLMINATEGGRPADLYRQMGFVDEIYWYQRYELVR